MAARLEMKPDATSVVKACGKLPERLSPTFRALLKHVGAERRRDRLQVCVCACVFTANWSDFTIVEDDVEP